MSMPSLCHWYANTMATSEDLAISAAAEASVPGLYSTLARGALAWIAFSGEVGNQM